MAIPVDEISERSRNRRPGEAALTAVAIPGVVIGWVIGRILVIIGWTAGKIWRILAFLAETISFGFRLGAGLPVAQETPEPKKQSPPV